MTLTNASSMFNMYQAATAGGPYLTEIVIKNTRILRDVQLNNFFSNNKAITKIDVGGFSDLLNMHIKFYKNLLSSF